MKLRFSFGNDPVSDKNPSRNYNKINHQSVSFFYISNTDDGICRKEYDIPREIDPDIDDEQEITTVNENKIPVYMHFQPRESRIAGQVFNTNYPGVGTSITLYDFFDFISIYRREVYYNPYNKNCYSDMIWQPVLKVENESGSKFIYRDYNIANRRLYQYAVYLTKNKYSDMSKVEYAGYYAPIMTNWSGWSITELIPTLDKNTYHATPKGVWRFNFNVSTGQMNQNMSKQQQDTLSNYPRISHGPKNSMSGSVSCLLGKDVLPAEYVYKKDVEFVDIQDHLDPDMIFFDTTERENIGGYIQDLGRFRGDCGHEYLSPNQVGFTNISSNPKIDMVNEWKEICYSGNPKLLKDPAGQIFIVQITSSSMNFNNNINGSPCEISFEWVQVGSPKTIIANQVAEFELYDDYGYTPTEHIQVDYSELDNLPSINDVTLLGDHRGSYYSLQDKVVEVSSSSIDARNGYRYVINSTGVGNTISIGQSYINKYDTFEIEIRNFSNQQFVSSTPIAWYGSKLILPGRNYLITMMKQDGALVASSVII